jgi:3-deoxy-D-manno-octulosonate 8-phosphate phosphatase (KDO 8-P phosphatase)
MILLDVDGTLTDGGIYVLDSGEEFKRFHVKDGMAIVRLRQQGYHFGFVSGSKSERAIRKRATDLGVERVYVGAGNKQAVVAAWLEELSLVPEQALFMGDDLNDLSVMRYCGVRACPADAAEPVRQLADIVTERRGGDACFRELADRYFLLD